MKYGKILVLTLVAFLISIMPVNAKRMDYKELGEEALTIDSGAGYIYVIGNYAYTSTYELSTSDIMLAAGDSFDFNFDATVDVKTKLGDMTVYLISRAYNGVGDPTGWTLDDNVLGNGTEFDDNKLVDIKYINYNFLSLDTKYSVKLDSNYKAYGYVGNSSDLALDDETHKLTGLVNFDKDGKVTAFDGSSTRYYFAYDLVITGYNENTTVKITGEKANNYTDASFDATDKVVNPDGTTTLKFLWELNPESETKTIIVEVDLDGEAKAYGTTKYVIDYSDVDFQKNTKAVISDAIPATDEEDFAKEPYGYEKHENSSYTITGSNYNYVIDGKVFKQRISDDAFGASKAYGWFVPVNISVEGMTEETTIIVPRHTEAFTGLTESLSVLFELNKGAEVKTFKIVVDLDGEGDEYLPTTYTIDYSKVVFAVDSEDEVSTLANKGEHYTATYESGNVNVNVNITDDEAAIAEVKKDLTARITAAMATGNYASVVATYNGKTYTVAQISDLVDAVVNGNAINLTGKSFTIKFTPVANVTDITTVENGTYTVKFTATTDTAAAVDAFVKALDVNEWFKAAYKDGVVTISMDGTAITDASEVAGTGIIRELDKLMATGIYGSIALKYKGESYIITSDSTKTTETFNNLINAMLNGKYTNLAGNKFEVEFTLISKDLKDTSKYDSKYEVGFEIVTNSNNVVPKLDDVNNNVNVKGKFTVDVVVDKDDKVAINVVIDQNVVKTYDDLKAISGTGLMSVVADLMAPGYYESIEILGVKYTAENVLTAKDAILAQLEEWIGEGTVKNLQGQTLTVKLNPINGVKNDGQNEYVVTLGVEPEVSSNVPESFKTGETVEFTITTEANGREGTMVHGVGGIYTDAAHEHEASDSILKIEYYEVKDGKWYELPGTGFGPVDGFALSDATSSFRVTFKDPGTYYIVFNVSTIDGDEVITSYSKTITVIQSEFEQTKDNSLEAAAKELTGKLEAPEAEDYGFSDVEYNKEDNTLTFTVEDGTKDIADFADSGIVDIFKEYVGNATEVTYTANGKEYTVDLTKLAEIEDETEYEDAVVNMAKDLIKAMLNEGEDYTLESLVDKVANAVFTYENNGSTYQFEYVLNFVRGE